MPPTVGIVAALDTKGAEAAFVKDALERAGVACLVIDVGVLGEPMQAADVSRAAVAAAGGASLETLVARQDKAAAMAAMTRGAAVIAAQLNRAGRIAGLLGLGGSAGTTIATSAMRALPIGAPKVMVSTVAAGDTRPYVGTKDVTMMYSVVDIAGINRLSARILANAAAAIAGMVRAEAPTVALDRPLLAASMFGNTTACVDRARTTLEAAGYEVLVFHATGAGGQTMESLIADGFVVGVLDVTTTEWADELCGGVFSAGPSRLEAAGAAGVAQVVAPGCLDMVNFGAMETVPAGYRERNLYQWNPSVTLMRTTPEENRRLGEIIGGKLNAARGPVAVLLPLRGVSQLDSPGNPFWWPEADAALYEALRAGLRADIRVEEIDATINDPVFADRAAALLLELIGQRGRAGA